MSKTKITTNPKVKPVFDNYPPAIRKKILNLRKLIIATADEIPELSDLEETLKWGEPSYLAKKGSTIRIDWKKKKPEQYAIYFKCTSKLVTTFREVYNNDFTYETNRAIVFQMEDKIPEKELKKCIKAALTYHKVKNLALLGM